MQNALAGLEPEQGTEPACPLVDIRSGHRYANAQPLLFVLFEASSWGRPLPTELPSCCKAGKVATAPRLMLWCQWFTKNCIAWRTANCARSVPAIPCKAQRWCMRLISGWLGSTFRTGRADLIFLH